MDIFLYRILQKIIIWAYTPTPEEREQMRAEDLAKIAELRKLVTPDADVVEK